MPARRALRFTIVRAFDPPIAPEAAPPIDVIPTYRQWQRDPFAAGELATVPELARLRIEMVGLPFPDHRPIISVEWTSRRFTFFDGAPYDDWRGHFIRATAMPPGVNETFISGCGITSAVEPFLDGDAWLIPVDERVCRGVFTAVACEPARCWVVGWY